MHEIVKAIEKAVEAEAEDGRRTHLGASIIGRKCARQVYYSFRWFYTVKHTGRMLRLFNVGHREEDQFIALLNKIGATVVNEDPATGKQYVFSTHGGHFGGSGDGFVSGLETYGLEGVGVSEFKTHNDKSFKKLKDSGVLTAKPEHYIQMQTYMGHFGCKWAIYVAINKNDSELYVEIVHFKPEIAAMYTDRAKAIIEAMEPPPRASEDKSWFMCKFCDFREICHYDQVPQKNCRTCVYSRPDMEEGGWRCGLFNGKIPLQFTKEGCDKWDPIK